MCSVFMNLFSHVFFPSNACSCTHFVNVPINSSAFNDSCVCTSKKIKACVKWFEARDHHYVHTILELLWTFIFVQCLIILLIFVRKKIHAIFLMEICANAEKKNMESNLIFIQIWKYRWNNYETDLLIRSMQDLFQNGQWAKWQKGQLTSIPERKMLMYTEHVVHAYFKYQTHTRREGCIQHHTHILKVD